MIRNRLGILMAERGIKISDVYEATKISRSTLTSISQNENKMIQLETIDSLCNYFGITPSEFFDYAPFILKYNCYMPEHRKKIVETTKSYRDELQSLGNDAEHIDYLINEGLDVFGDSRYVIEIIVLRGQKHYKYLMSIDIFPIGSGGESNASNDFDIEVMLIDHYGDKSFVDDIYNNVSVTFQTQIKNTCLNLIEDNLTDLQDYANSKNTDLKVFIQTPFGDSDITITPNFLSNEELKEKYGINIVNRWEK